MNTLIPPQLRPLMLLIGVAAAVAAGVGVVLWTKEPTYALLYGNLGQQDAAQIAQALDPARPRVIDQLGAAPEPEQAFCLEAEDRPALSSMAHGPGLADLLRPAPPQLGRDLAQLGCRPA